MTPKQKRERAERLAELRKAMKDAASRYAAWIGAGNAVDGAPARQLFNRAERTREHYHRALERRS